MHPPHTKKYYFLRNMGDYPMGLIELRKKTTNRYILVIDPISLYLIENPFQVTNKDNVSDKEVIIEYD